MWAQDLSDIEIVHDSREYLENELQEIVFSEEINLSDIAFRYANEKKNRDREFGFRTKESKKVIGCGHVKYRFGQKDYIPPYGAVIFKNGTTLEFFKKDNDTFKVFYNGSELCEFNRDKSDSKFSFNQWGIHNNGFIWGVIKSKNKYMIHRNSHSITTKQGNFPIYICRNGNIIKTFLRGIEHIWPFKSSKLQEQLDYVIPQRYSNMLNEDDLKIYFSVSILFRCVLYDHDFVDMVVG